MRYKINTDEGAHYLEAPNAGIAQMQAQLLWPDDNPTVEVPDSNLINN